MGSWADTSEESPLLNQDIPSPRLEIRFRDKLLIDNNEESAVCDLWLVYNFSNYQNFNCLSSVKTSDVNAFKKAVMPFRMLGDCYALMYQLNMPLYVSYKDDYYEIKFPTDLDELPNGVRSLINK